MTGQAKHLPKRSHCSRREWALAAGVLALVLGAVLLPALPQDPAYHRFADARSLLGVPHALDTLSNLAFVVLGIHGLHTIGVRRRLYSDQTMNASAIVFFAGFILIGIGSAYYHLAPHDFRLAWDRLGMVVTFAGVLGMTGAQRVSARAGFSLLIFTLLVGPLSVVARQITGSVTPYAVVQFGGIALLLGLLFCPARRPGPNWVALITAYALAKLLEIGDEQVFALTEQFVSGHTLKHLVAALAALAVTLSLRRGDSALTCGQP